MGMILFMISFMMMSTAYHFNLKLVRKYATHMTHDEVDEVAKRAMLTKYIIIGAFALMVIEVLYILNTGVPTQ